MTGTLPGEEDTVSLRIEVSEELKEEYKDCVTSMSADMRSHMRQVVNEPDSEELDAPRDETLAEAYHWLVDASNADGIVPKHLAHNQLSQKLGYSKDMIHGQVIKPLVNAGYCQVQNPEPGTRGGCIRVRRFTK